MKLQSAVEYLITYSWAILILAGVIVVLYELGFFSPAAFVNNQCTFPADFSCLYSQISTNGILQISLQQATAAPINITAIACSITSTFSNQIVYGPNSYIYLPIGSVVNLTVPCYVTSVTQWSGSIGQIFKGYVLVNYTSYATTFQHSTRATVVEKVS